MIRTKLIRSSTAFELIHSYLCGHMKHSIGGTQFYIIYIDDCTRYTEVYFLITKSAEEYWLSFKCIRHGSGQVSSRSRGFSAIMDSVNTTILSSWEY